MVTGATKGNGFETVRQLASQDVTVVLTAQNQKRKMEGFAEAPGVGFVKYSLSSARCFGPS